MKVVIPMAGLGSRFQMLADENPAYRVPKPFIKVHGLPMVRWATGSLPFVEHAGQRVSSPIRVTPADLVFIILAEHDAEHGIERGLKEIYGNDITVIVLPALTRGASETAYQAKAHVAPDEALLITDSDHYFDGTPLARAIEVSLNTSVAGIIPVFTPPADNIPRWSYSLTQQNGTRILQVGEKDRELMEAGAAANIGAYYFSKAGTFFDLFEKVERENKMFGEEGKKEFYVAPMFQELIEMDGHVEAAHLPQVWGLGTPTDLEAFLSDPDAPTTL